MPSISTSKYSTLRECPRLFYFSYVMMLERKEVGGARAFGDLYHLGLEAWWNYAGEGDVPWKEIDGALVNALKAIDDKAYAADTNRYEVAKAEVMVTAYHAIYFDMEFHLLGTTGTEQWFRAPLLDYHRKPVEGWTIVGRQDVLAHVHSFPKASIVEHKTTGADLSPMSNYWPKVKIDGQGSLYIEAANEAGFDVGQVLWDAAKKPEISPELETPMHERELTKGKGCKACGGTASGDIVKGTGVVPERDATAKKKRKTVESEPEPGERCPECDGEGWKKLEPLPDGTPQYDAPKYKAFVNVRDEPVEDYKARISDAIAKDPLAYFKQVPITFTDDELAEARADLVSATVEIDSYVSYARKLGDGNALAPQARLAFPRNTKKCHAMYGRGCDFAVVCHGPRVDPTTSPLFQIKERKHGP